jgi:hypothetical protein
MVETIVHRFVVDPTFEELGDVSAAASLNDELATRVVRSVVGRI